MTRTMSRISLRVLQQLALAVLVALAGCATVPSAPAGPSIERLLTAAGFKTVAASSVPQLQRLPALPQGQVTAVTQTGRSWFVYPDPVNQRIFVGTRAEYDAYLRLQAQSGLPAQDPYASSIRQDEAMTAKSKRYASVPEWELEEWPEFGNLGW
jgi:hypothetical protein